MSDLQQRLSSALHDLAPAEPSTESLAAGALRYHRRARRRHLLASAVAAVAVLVGSAVALTSLTGPDRALPARPQPTSSGPCIPTSATPAGYIALESVHAAWICPDPSAGQRGDGWTLPRAPLTGNYAQMVSAPELNQNPCLPARPGPGFVFVRQDGAGHSVKYPSSDDHCGGIRTLLTYYDALADQEADGRAAGAPDDVPVCRSWPWSTDQVSGRLPDGPLVSAKFCLRPRLVIDDGETPKLTQPVIARSYRTIGLTGDVLARLNEDLQTMHTGFYGNGECLGEGNWTYAIVGRTRTGQELMLVTGCLDEFVAADGYRTGFIPSAGTQAALRALVPAR